MKNLSFLILTLLLIGCEAKRVEVVTVSNIKKEDCGDRELQYLVGKDRSVLYTIRFPNPTRILEPNSMTTMDYSPVRLNIYINKKGKISKVNCG